MLNEKNNLREHQYNIYVLNVIILSFIPNNFFRIFLRHLLIFSCVHFAFLYYIRQTGMKTEKAFKNPEASSDVMKL